MISKSVFRLFCVCLLAVLFSRCQEGSAPELTLPQGSSLIERAKWRFERSVVYASISNGDLGGYWKKTPQWERAYTVNLAIGRGLLVPVLCEEPLRFIRDLTGKRKLAASMVTNLLIYTGDDRQLHYALLSSFPDGRAGGGFTGIICVEDWYGNPLTPYRCKGDGTLQVSI